MTATVGYAQFEPQYAEPALNRDAMTAIVQIAGRFDLLVFPELAVTGYELRDVVHARNLAEPFRGGVTTEWARALAVESGGTIIVGYVEQGEGVAYNSCVLALPNGGVHNYRKIHLFSREKELFAPGDAPPPVIDTPAGSIGVMICFDWIFPETARTLALQGAQIIAHPSNLVLPYCQRAMYCRSVDNRVFTITANRIGTENQAGRELTYTGQSQILDPDGNILAAAPADQPHTALVTIDPEYAHDKSINEYNDLTADRRPSLYDL